MAPNWIVLTCMFSNPTCFKLLDYPQSLATRKTIKCIQLKTIIATSEKNILLCACVGQISNKYRGVQGRIGCTLVMATGLSRPGKSRDLPGRDGTGQDLETLKVLWSCGPGTKEVQKSLDFFLKWPFDKKLISYLVMRVRTCKYTVHKYRKNAFMIHFWGKLMFISP